MTSNPLGQIPLKRSELSSLEDKGLEGSRREQEKRETSSWQSEGNQFTLVSQLTVLLVGGRIDWQMTDAGGRLFGIAHSASSVRTSNSDSSSSVETQPSITCRIGFVEASAGLRDWNSQTAL